MSDDRVMMTSWKSIYKYINEPVELNVRDERTSNEYDKPASARNSVFPKVIPLPYIPTGSFTQSTHAHFSTFRTLIEVKFVTDIVYE